MSEESKKSSRQARIDESKGIISGALSRIFKDLKLFEEFLNVMSKFDYSVRDTLLIADQSPQITQLKTFEEWNSGGQKINKGEKGITLPDRDNGKNVWFDISQTNAPVPNIGSEKDRTPKEKLRSLLSNNRVRILTVSKPEHTKGRPAYFDPEYKVIFLDRTAPFEALYPALAEELAHADLYRHNADNYKRADCETVAKMSSYIICKQNNMKPNTVTVSKDLKDLPEEQAETVLDSVKFVSDEIKSNIEYYYANGKDKFERPSKKQKIAQKPHKEDMSDIEAPTLDQKQETAQELPQEEKSDNEMPKTNPTQETTPNIPQEDKSDGNAPKHYKTESKAERLKKAKQQRIRNKDKTPEEPVKSEGGKIK